jgi:hypothetical protein
MLKSVSSRDKEQQKTDKQKNDDWGYVSVHAISCILSDPLTAPFSSLVQEKLTGKANIGSHISAEFLGDIVAVPATIAIQRFLPEANNLIRNIVEPLFGGAYQSGAEREAKCWSEKNNIDINSNDFLDYKTQKYEYEMSKLPMQINWTITSLFSNVIAQKTLFHNEESARDIAISLVGGVLATAIMQNVARVAFPQYLHNVDNFISDNVVAPATKIFGKTADKQNVVNNSYDKKLDAIVTNV